MEFAKLRVKNLDKQEEFEVLFNPTQYSIEASNSWKEQERIRSKPELQFTGQSLKKLTMELFFDTYERKEDVRQHTGRITQLLVADIDESNGKRPPRCELSWAQQNPTGSDFPFVGVLESVTQQFVLFLNNGTPVRAKLSVSFKEYIPPTQQQQEHPQTTSFPAQTYTVKAGDTLSAIAAGLWDDPTLWRLLADENAIINPRLLEPGRILTVPPIA
jgi:LysM repeat protein